MGDLGLIPGLEDPLGKEKVTHSSILAWRIPWTTVHGVTKSQTRLRDFHSHTHVREAVITQNILGTFFLQLPYTSSETKKSLCLHSHCNDHAYQSIEYFLYYFWIPINFGASIEPNSNYPLNKRDSNLPLLKISVRF